MGRSNTIPLESVWLHITVVLMLYRLLTFGKRSMLEKVKAPLNIYLSVLRIRAEEIS